jgi:hypothetical protein
MLRKTMLAALVAGAFAVIVAGPGAIAETTTPADKAAITANDIDTVNDDEVILSEQMKVDSTIDLILQTSAECSILTRLVTQGGDVAEESDGAFGQVKLWLTVDGTPVPVAGEGDEDGGKVVFGNRAYQRTATDRETDTDGIDGESDFIRTRTANAFNWMAFDAGKKYDKPYNGNNIVDIELHAEYTRETQEDDVAGENPCPREADNLITSITEPTTCADAFVGSRTLIVEATHAANGETYQPEPATTESSTDSGGTSIGGISLP